MGAIKRKLPKGFVWEMQAARKKSSKGRAKGGMVAGIRKELIEGSRGIKVGEEGIIEVRAKIGAKRWLFGGIYVSGDMDKKLEWMYEWTEGGGR